MAPDRPSPDTPVSASAAAHGSPAAAAGPPAAARPVPPSAYAALAIMPVFFGLSFAGTKVALRGFNPLLLATTRFVVAGLVLFAVWRWRRGRRTAHPRRPQASGAARVRLADRLLLLRDHRHLAHHGQCGEHPRSPASRSSSRVTGRHRPEGAQLLRSVDRRGWSPLQEWSRWSCSAAAWTGARCSATCSCWEPRCVPPSTRSWPAVSSSAARGPRGLSAAGMPRTRWRPRARRPRPAPARPPCAPCSPSPPSRTSLGRCSWRRWPSIEAALFGFKRPTASAGLGLGYLVVFCSVLAYLLLNYGLSHVQASKASTFTNLIAHRRRWRARS